MIGSFLTRSLALALGYAYPAYECFKTVELNRPEIEKLRFWCQYWILVAALTVFERVGDTFISWLPMYSEAKVAFFVYLWYPKTRGATYVYETFFQPYVASHETEIDRNLLELKARAGDIVLLYWQKAASYGQTRVFEIFQYIASQSTKQQSRSQSTMQRQPVQNNRQSQALASPARQAAAALQPKQPSRAPPSPTKNKNQGSAKDAGDPRAVPTSQTQLSSSTPTLPAAQQPSRAPPSPTKNKNQGPAKDAGDPRAVPTSQTQLSSSTPTLPAASESTSQPSTIEGGEMQIAVTTIATNAIAATVKPDPPPQESTMEEAIPMTRGRLRKRAASSGPSTH